MITAPRGPLHSIQHLPRNSIEKSCTQLTKSSTVIMGGPQLSFLNDVQWDQLCSYEEIIFARTTPEQKLQIVREFQNRGYCVAMTGDGINDAPSLKAADIGITMSSGSDIAIEAADIVLLDSIAAIVVAIEYGRLVADNLKKTIIYRLPAGLFSELWTVLLNIFLGLPQILSRFLMIVISTLTDCAAATLLVFEKPEGNLLSRPPRHIKRDHIANAKLLIHGFLFIGVLECVTSMAMAFWYLERKGIPFSVLLFSFGSYPPEYDAAYIATHVTTASSIYFVNLVIMQLFNLFGVRTRRFSILQQDPIVRRQTRNLWLFPAMGFALSVGMHLSRTVC
jgi:sodium/potassium-transporting ATPase subunit alpha